MSMVAQLAPDFKAMAYVNGEFKEISLKDYQGKGKWICLFFYPFDFTFVCPTEIRAFGEMATEFEKKNCQIIGCSTDSEFTHRIWYKNEFPEIKFPILADTNHQISKAYGVLKEEKGAAFRGTFLIDPQGNLKSMSINDFDIGRSVEEIFRLLCACQTGGLCPANWKVGQPTLSV